jgi:hypothetical protein
METNKPLPKLVLICECGFEQSLGTELPLADIPCSCPACDRHAEANLPDFVRSIEELRGALRWGSDYAKSLESAVGVSELPGSIFKVEVRDER